MACCMILPSFGSRSRNWVKSYNNGLLNQSCNVRFNQAVIDFLLSNLSPFVRSYNTSHQVSKYLNAARQNIEIRLITEIQIKIFCKTFFLGCVYSHRPSDDFDDSQSRHHANPKIFHFTRQTPDLVK